LERSRELSCREENEAARADTAMLRTVIKLLGLLLAAPLGIAALFALAFLVIIVFLVMESGWQILPWWR
jgi:hypothetical protein